MLEKLQTEVRSAFARYEQINGATAASLKYLHAVCLEALRVFPPLPLALPRVVSPGGDVVDGLFVPEGVSSMLPDKLVEAHCGRLLSQPILLQQACRLRTFANP